MERGGNAIPGVGLIRRRSLAAAALFFLVLLDEIEGLAFIILSVVAHRADLFVDAQELLFPVGVVVAGVATAFFFWRHREPAVEETPETLSAATLFDRIGMTPRRVVPEAGGAKWRRALR